jgi:hypothetical protein
MRKETRAKLATGLLAAALVAYVAFRNSGGRMLENAASAVRGVSSEKKDAEPREAIYAMLDAARDGDVAAYLDCHTGQLARRIAQSRDEMTPDGFARYLRERNREIKGVAIEQPQFASSNEARIRVEYVYQDRNEAQQVVVERIDGKWRIAGVETAERVKTLVPYGTPVY